MLPSSWTIEPCVNRLVIAVRTVTASGVTP